MIERLHLSAILLVAAAIWGGLLFLGGVQVSPQWLHPFSIVLGAMMVFLSAFDLWLWRIRLLHPWLVKRPVLGGTWRAELRSDWIDPATGLGIGPINGFIVVRQTFSRLTLRLITEESNSELIGAEILRADDGTYRVLGVYRNEPKLSVRHRSPIHYGALAVQLSGSPPERIEGHYWTDRDTAGELALSDRRTAHVDDLVSARKLYGMAH
jgi:hypothetical protein